MGLDMYLTAERYVSEYVPSDQQLSEEVGQLTPLPGSVQTIGCRVGYWRKANQIHKWFVDHVQDSVDQCDEYTVTEEHVQELLNTCRKVVELAKLVPGQLHNGTTYSSSAITEHYVDGQVIENAQEIAELLPCEGGFFFGNTDYDEWYLKDVTHTITVLEDWQKFYIEEVANKRFWDLKYQASW